ncbi:MAG: Nif3-like dinuclear metal center hexameric protein [Spirochaetales bacterium]|nr:Nif3-like dinuclear metal center hexameric protein [Spirochaetales bacterium]
MLIEEFDSLMKELLAIEQFANIDSALNGLQVGRNDPELKKIAFAVDASGESFQRAASWGADLLFTHHGIFFGKMRPVTGVLYARLQYLLENQLALYTAHLPLDIHPEFGTNAGIAGLLKLKHRKVFGLYHGVKMGIKGTLPKELSLAEISVVLCKNSLIPPRCLAFGKEKINTVGIVSGGAAGNVRDAIEEGLDLYITGEATHSVYHECSEAGINVMFIGHYLSEVWGVQALQQKIAQATHLKTCFIDIPTGY